MSDSVSCTQEDLDHGTVCLTTGQSIGLAVDAEAGLLSIIALTGAFVMIFIKVYRSGKVVQRPMDLFILALFSFDIVMALGRITSIKWVQEGKVFQGGYCTAQGIIQQFGETGSAMVTMAIAIYTFVVVMWGTFRRQLLVAYLVVGFILVFVAVFIGVTVSTQTHGTEHYMAPDGFWCWIGGDGTHYNPERYAGEYVWMWTALSISVIAYVPLSFVALGILRVSPTCWWKFEVHGRGDAPADGRRRRSINMIAYPVVYFAIVTPTSIVRWVSGFGTSPKTMPSAATLATEFLFSLSGLANVFIFIFTRKDLFIAGNDGKSQSSKVVPLLPPADGSGSDDMELTDPQSHPQTILPSTDDDGGWTLPSAPHDSESQEVV